MFDWLFRGKVDVAGKDVVPASPAYAAVGLGYLQGWIGALLLKWNLPPEMADLINEHLIALLLALARGLGKVLRSLAADVVAKGGFKGQILGVILRLLPL